MFELAALSFANPWLLAALLALPALWLILRVTPPSPRTVQFPAIRLLYGLQSTEKTPDSAPWWLLLLRIAFAALAILAFAHPFLSVGPVLNGQGAVILIIDDGWTAGRDWNRRVTAAEAVIAMAERDNRNLFLVPSSLDPDSGRVITRPVQPSEARELLRVMAPKPWPIDLERLQAILEDGAILRPATSADIVWLANPIADAGENRLMTRLRQLGHLTIVTETSDSPKTLAPPITTSREIAVTAARADAAEPESFAIRALAADGRLLARVESGFAAGERDKAVTITLPIELRNESRRIEIEGETTAAAVVLLDHGFERRPVGLVTATAFREGQPLLDEGYYLERALSPFSEVLRGPLADQLQRGVSSLLLGDTGVLAESDRKQLDGWIRAGGILVRFAGPRLAAASLETGGLEADDLVPVRLRSGNRALGGALSWSSPLTISGFAERGPFSGMDEYEPVTVHRQVLAEPAIDLDERVWARLTDGTPVVTAESREQGWLVLFHTTATPDWSDLPLSGLFVDMLRRVAELGVAAVGERSNPLLLTPLESLDGFGTLGPAPASARALKGATRDLKPAASSEHPPGYYGSGPARHAVNLTIPATQLQPSPKAPAGVSVLRYWSTSAIDFKALLIQTALLLFVIDLLITLFLRGLFLPRRASTGKGALAALLLASVMAAPQAHAAADDTDDAFALAASLDVRLAFVITGDEAVDAVSDAGLSSLSTILRQRTAVEAAAPVAVDLETDDLSFFPLLYWPIPASHPPLSDAAAARINRFMKNGGTVLFDTRDHYESGLPGGGSGIRRLRQLSRDLDIPALVPVTPDHVLTRTFYLLGQFPGRFQGGVVWVQDRTGLSGSEVTPVILGSHDWSSAWARDENGLFTFPVVPGGEMQREIAFRFGINLVMHALTGNYKADQVHVPSILERLGK